jgi:hypothetical protein
MLDPRITNIAIDANALDRDGTPRDALVDRFQSLTAAGRLTVVVAGGVRDEVLHPHTPADVRDAVLSQIFNLRPGLIASQHDDRRRVAGILRGNARSDQHAADASHLSEAAETGCAYFITHDKRMLKKRDELRRVLPPSLSIVTLTEFLEIFDAHDSPRASGAPKISVDGAGGDDWISDRATEKARAAERIKTALSTIELSKKEPDRWERRFLAQAIGALFRGIYSLAFIEAENALTPVDERGFVAVDETDELVQTYGLSTLRRAFVAAQAEPLRRFPHFGEIRFAGEIK